MNMMKELVLGNMVWCKATSSVISYGDIKAFMASSV